MSRRAAAVMQEVGLDLAGQLGLLTPAVLGLCVWWLVRHPPRRLEGPGAPAWWRTAAPLLLMVALSLTRRVEANWPGPAWLGALCGAASRWPALPRWGRPLRRAGRNLPRREVFRASTMKSSGSSESSSSVS